MTFRFLELLQQYGLLVLVITHFIKTHTNSHLIAMCVTYSNWIDYCKEVFPKRILKNEPYCIFFVCLFLVFQTETVQQSSNDAIFYKRKGQSKWNRVEDWFHQNKKKSQTTWHQKHNHGLLQEISRTHAGRL